MILDDELRAVTLVRKIRRSPRDGRMVEEDVRELLALLRDVRVDERARIGALDAARGRE